MTRFVYRTATTLTGQLADDEDSLAWLFAVDQGDADPEDGQDDGLVAFMAGVGVLVQGATTYGWVLAEAGLLARPEQWQGLYGDRPTFVFTSRRLPVPAGADVRLVAGPVAGHLDAIRAVAGQRDVWLMGGGDLVGQFDAAGALDEIAVSIAPVTLPGGRPLLPRRIESDRLRLTEVRRRGQFVEATYAVRPGPA